MAEGFKRYYGEAVEQSLAELDRLLVLGEQVSKDLEKSRANSFRQIGYVFIILMILASIAGALGFFQIHSTNAYGNFDTVKLLTILLSGVILSTYAAAILTVTFNQKKWRVEREILTDILVMASSILEPLQSLIGSVEYTVLKMRMRRLGFGNHSTPSFLPFRM